MVEGLVIRKVQESDYQDIYETMACPGVVRNTLQLPYMSMDFRKRRIEELGPKDHILVAEIGGKVIGDIYLGCGRNRRAHTGQIGMGIHDDYQGKGIGTALMKAVVDLADNWLNLMRLELQVYVDNEPGVRLYKRFDFVVEGTHKQFAFRDGYYVDVYSMGRIKGVDTN